jgi:ABC-type methionine transport system permease subunit
MERRRIMLTMVSGLLGLVSGVLLTILFFTAPPSFLTMAPATCWWVSLVVGIYENAQEKMTEKL